MEIFQSKKYLLSHDILVCYWSCVFLFFFFLFSPLRRKPLSSKALFYLGQFRYHAGIGCKIKMTKILQWLLNLNEFLFCVSNKINSFKYTRLIGRYIVKYFSKCIAMHLAVADTFLVFVCT